MATKTWKIGEYARGGIIQVKVTKTHVFIIGKDWDFSTGSHKLSDQSNAKVFYNRKIPFTSLYFQEDVTLSLDWLTTAYYTQTIMRWIQEKLPVERRFRYPL